jgi:hypothetical protein
MNWGKVYKYTKTFVKSLKKEFNTPVNVAKYLSARSLASDPLSSPPLSGGSAKRKIRNIRKTRKKRKKTKTRKKKNH